MKNRDLLLENGLLVDRVFDAGPSGRVMDASAKAGFYTDSYGWLPWSWANDEIDAFELWRIVKKFSVRDPTDEADDGR